jgi:hypothetical protein
MVADLATPSPGPAPARAAVRLADLVAALSLGVDLGFGQPRLPAASPTPRAGWAGRAPRAVTADLASSSGRYPRTAGQARAAGPRLVICAAMIERWTSLVPSQMRSTRSSRKKRSATFSRM